MSQPIKVVVVVFILVLVVVVVRFRFFSRCGCCYNCWFQKPTFKVWSESGQLYIKFVVVVFIVVAVGRVVVLMLLILETYL